MSFGRDQQSGTSTIQMRGDQDAATRNPGKSPRTGRIGARGDAGPAPVQRAGQGGSSETQAQDQSMLGAALGTQLPAVQMAEGEGATTAENANAETSAGDAAAPAQPGAEAPAAPGNRLPRTINGANALTVFNDLAAKPTADQERVADQLGSTRRAALSRNLEHGQVANEAGNPLLRVLFEKTPASERTTMINWFELRFGLEVGPTEDDGIQWDKRGLRRSWDVLQALPPDHVEGNPDMLRYTRYRSSSIEGYATEDGESAIGYGRENDIDNETETGAFTDDGDVMRGTNVFDATVRHEVGHLVDSSVNGSDGYCRTAAGGGWETWSDGSGMAEIMVRQSGGAVSSWANPAQKQEIVETLQGVIDDRAPEELDDRLAAMSFIASEDDGATLLETIMNDEVVGAVRVSFSDQAPWDLPNGGVALGGRIYQEAYEQADWVSYAQEARERKVSRYQFRAHWEWFAEAYAAYYQPPGEKGALLKGRDDATKAWFDSNVDPKGGKGGTVPADQAGNAAKNAPEGGAAAAPQAPAQANAGGGGGA